MSNYYLLRLSPRSHFTAETRRAVYSWLGKPSPDDKYEDSVEKRVGNTCDWVLDRPFFTSWMEPEDSSGLNLLGSMHQQALEKQYCVPISFSTCQALWLHLWHISFSRQITRVEKVHLWL